MKIGIPRAMYYYFYKDLWINFFKFLDIDIIISPKTNKEIINLGLKYSQDEMCLSMKNYIGHIAYLKDKCDYILIPRIDNFGIDNQTCTNFLASYDIINNLFNINLLNYNINGRNGETEEKGFIDLGKSLGISKSKTLDAYKKAKEKYNELRNYDILNNIRKLNSERIKILIVSHPYNTYDEYIGKPIINMLNNYDIEIIYSDLFDDTDKSSKYTKNLYWKYSKENISSLAKSIDKIDGVIFLSTFPCGLDSLVNELVMRKINKPYLNIIIDDNSISGGIETRIESFIDIIKKV